MRFGMSLPKRPWVAQLSLKLRGRTPQMYVQGMILPVERPLY